MKDTDAQIEFLKEKLQASEQQSAMLEAQLQLSEQRYHDLFSNLGDEVHKWKLVRGADGEILTWELVDANLAALQSWNTTREAVIGKTTNEIFNYDATAQFMPAIQKAFKTKEPIKWVEYFAPTDQYLSMVTTPIGEEFISIGRDITPEKRTEIFLKESKELLSRTELISNQGSWKYDFLTGNWTFSENWYKIFGYTKQPGIVERLEAVDPRDRAFVTSTFERAIRGLKTFDIEHRITTVAGQTRWVNVSAELIRSDEGEPVSLIGITRDITERKKDLSRVEMLTKAIDYSQNGFDIVDHEGKFVYVNYAHSRMFGYDSPEEVMRMSPGDFCMDPNFPNELIKYLREKGEHTCELKAKRKDGTEFTLLMYSRLDYDEHGNEIYPSSSIDITEKRKSDQELIKKEEELRNVINSIPGTIYQFVFEKDGGFSIPFMSNKATDLMGFSMEQMRDPNFLFSRLHPEDYERTINSVLEVNKGSSIWNQEFRAYDNDGNMRWIQGSAYGAVDEWGRVVHHGVLFDITSQKEAEIALNSSREAYRNITDNLPGMVLKYKLNPDGSDKLLFISEGVADLYEISPQEALENNGLLWGRVHPEDLDFYVASVQQSAKELSHWKLEHRLLFPNGKVKWVDMRGVPSLQKDGSIIWDSIGLDITKRKEAEEALERVNSNLEQLVEERAQKAIQLSRELERYWLAAEHSKSGVWRFDVLTNSLEWDTIMYELYGIDASEFPQAYEAWVASFHPDDSVESINALQQTITTGKDLDILFRIMHGKSGEVRYLRAKGKVEKDESGNTIAVFGTNWDVTREMELVDEREKALNNLKQAQTQLIQSEKMASLGVLTAGVAHELNNPLNFILGGYSALLQELEGEGPLDKAELMEYLQWIKTGAERASGIVKSLNLYSRSNKEKAELCDLHQIIEDCLLILQIRFKNRITITKNYTDVSVVVQGNHGKLHQVFLNLLSNAIDAIQAEGEIIIESSTHSGCIVVTIQDNGCGIDEKNLGIITDPFFTTKAPGKGTGLGLSITQSIIKEHEGQLQFSSKLHEGSIFTIKLPQSNTL